PRIRDRSATLIPLLIYRRPYRATYLPICCLSIRICQGRDRLYLSCRFCTRHLLSFPTRRSSDLIRCLYRNGLYMIQHMSTHHRRIARNRDRLATLIPLLIYRRRYRATYLTICCLSIRICQGRDRRYKTSRLCTRQRLICWWIHPI